MYTITRQEASDILWVSIRSVDRYIKSGKIRAEKQWKVILLNKDDVLSLSPNSTQKQKIITNSNLESSDLEKEIVIKENSWIVKKDEYEKILTTFEKMYSGFREEIKQKDEKIQELSIELWKVLEQKNNFVDLMEYKKVQFLSEETKKSLLNNLEKEKQEKEKINKELKYEKTTNKLLILFIIILFIISGVIFFMNI